MKKAFIIFVANIYLLVFSGLSVSFHFCDDQLDSFTLIGAAPNCGCDEEENDGCCHDQHFYFKDNTEHQQSGVTEKISHPIVAILPSFTQERTAKLPSCQCTKILSEPKPPGLFKYRKHILLSKFTC